jgi:hypothetical protein
MGLTGDAKREYQRELMRKRRGGLKQALLSVVPSARSVVVPEDVPAGVVVVPLADPALVHAAIAEAVGEVSSVTVAWEGKVLPIVRALPTESEDTYVHRLVHEARTNDRQRIARVRTYATWRYRGYLAGKVATL